MPKTSSHIIQKQIIELQMPSHLPLMEVQDAAVALFKEVLKELIGECLDRFFPGEALVRLDSLTVDLGNLPIEGWEEVFAERFVEAFEAALEEARLALPSDSETQGPLGLRSPATDAGTAHSTERGPLAALEYFLDHGFLPWWQGEHGKSAIGQLVEALLSLPGGLSSALKARLHAALTQPLALNRLVQALSDEALARLAQAMDRLAPQAVPAMASICRLLTAPALGIQRPAARLAIWQAAFAGQPHALKAEEILAEAILTLAVERGSQPMDLLQAIVSADPQLSGDQLRHVAQVQARLAQAPALAQDRRAQVRLRKAIEALQSWLQTVDPLHFDLDKALILLRDLQAALPKDTLQAAINQVITQLNAARQPLLKGPQAPPSVSSLLRLAEAMQEETTQIPAAALLATQDIFLQLVRLQPQEAQAALLAAPLRLLAVEIMRLRASAGASPLAPYLHASAAKLLAALDTLAPTDVPVVVSGKNEFRRAEGVGQASPAALPTPSLPDLKAQAMLLIADQVLALAMSGLNAPAEAPLAEWRGWLKALRGAELRPLLVDPAWRGLLQAIAELLGGAPQQQHFRAIVQAVRGISLPGGRGPAAQPADLRAALQDLMALTEDGATPPPFAQGQAKLYAIANLLQDTAAAQAPATSEAAPALDAKAALQALRAGLKALGTFARQPLLQSGLSVRRFQELEKLLASPELVRDERQQALVMSLLLECGEVLQAHKHAQKVDTAAHATAQPTLELVAVMAPVAATSAEAIPQALLAKMIRFLQGLITLTAQIEIELSPAKPSGSRPTPEWQQRWEELRVRLADWEASRPDEEDGIEAEVDHLIDTPSSKSVDAPGHSSALSEGVHPNPKSIAQAEIALPIDPENSGASLAEKTLALNDADSTLGDKDHSFSENLETQIPDFQEIILLQEDKQSHFTHPILAEPNVLDESVSLMEESSVDQEIIGFTKYKEDFQADIPSVIDSQSIEKGQDQNVLLTGLEAGLLNQETSTLSPGVGLEKEKSPETQLNDAEKITAGRLPVNEDRAKDGLSEAKADVFEAETGKETSSLVGSQSGSKPSPIQAQSTASAKNRPIPKQIAAQKAELLIHLAELLTPFLQAESIPDALMRWWKMLPLEELEALVEAIRQGDVQKTVHAVERFTVPHADNQVSSKIGRASAEVEGGDIEDKSKEINAIQVNDSDVSNLSSEQLYEVADKSRARDFPNQNQLDTDKISHPSQLDFSKNPDLNFPKSIFKLSPRIFNQIQSATPQSQIMEAGLDPATAHPESIDSIQIQSAPAIRQGTAPFKAVASLQDVRAAIVFEQEKHALTLVVEAFQQLGHLQMAASPAAGGASAVPMTPLLHQVQQWRQQFPGQALPKRLATAMAQALEVLKEALALPSEALGQAANAAVASHTAKTALPPADATPSLQAEETEEARPAIPLAPSSAQRPQSSSAFHLSRLRFDKLQLATSPQPAPLKAPAAPEWLSPRRHQADLIRLLRCVQALLQAEGSLDGLRGQLDGFTRPRTAAASTPELSAATRQAMAEAAQQAKNLLRAPLPARLYTTLRALQGSLLGQTAQSRPDLRAVQRISSQASELLTSNKVKPAPKQPEKEVSIYVKNAGLVLLWPFIPRFFQNLGLVEGREFVSPEAHGRAVLFLQYLADPDPEFAEHLLPLCKLLCAYPDDRPITLALDPSEDEIELCEGLLGTVPSHHPAMKNMRVEGFRTAWLQREGCLKPRHDHVLLHVEKQAYDILLEQLPWSIRVIRLPWMHTAILTEW